ncbi:phage minor head protein [Buttiauxella sp. 3AFRM03]|uniref:phage head morphogenesis protein n=1 Tax=Buttiauxella sp. 3AFRM03 TaxID=2479367 RepID=UPI001EE47440|nr:phage minor head protein [Buttiauxella sp. 3AFRM03]
MSQKKAKSKTLRPVNYNAGNMIWYQHQMMELVRQMQVDVKSSVLPIIEDNPMAMDANPVKLVRHALQRLAEKWITRFVEESLPIAAKFTAKTTAAADRSLLASARKDSMTINMQWTPAMLEKQEAIISENVALIRSIPTQYFTEVESMVFRSMAKGGDRKALSDEIEASFGKRFGITRRRAEFIAKDQTRKATSALSAARQQAAGIREGEWVHSGGGNQPRHSHVKAGKERKRFDLSKGCLIDGEYIMPGQLPHCGCTWKPVLPF